jgi:DeoR/GlpR family transcriptional regulator of sugar metabolism
LVLIGMKLSNEERRQRIAEQVSRGGVSVNDLVRGFGVSEMTIRRDFAALEEQGKIVRVHGGAISTERLALEFSFKVKEAQNTEAKKAIGETAARLVRPMDAVFIDTGSTALAVARAIRSQRPRVIVTSNLAAALDLVGERDMRVLVTGGELSPHSPDLHGEWAMQILSTISVDIAFFGCDAVDPASGFYASDTRSAAITRLVLSRAQLSYLVADSSKFGKRAMCEVASLRQLAGVVTDAGLPAKCRKDLDAHKINLIVSE